MLLNCPIRGELNRNEKAKDGISYTEEYQRVQCVNFLLNKGYKKRILNLRK